MNRDAVSSMTKAAILLAAGQILPFITGQIPEIGRMLSPMHIPVLICGFLCGWKYGALVGFICPLLRSVLFGMPAMFPSAVGMAFELMTYGFVTGFLSEKMGIESIGKIYVILIISMIVGRIVWGIAQVILLGMTGSAFTFQAFLAGALINAVPAIILQLLIIPYLVRIITKREQSIPQS